MSQDIQQHRDDVCLAVLKKVNEKHDRIRTALSSQKETSIKEVLLVQHQVEAEQQCCESSRFQS